MNDPIALFEQWFTDVRAHPADSEPNAMVLATATRDGVPSARVVLLKAFDARGFVFYTHLTSRKSLELKANPQASLCFNWIHRGRQVRIDGPVEQVSDKEADEYFATRPFGARIGAVVSKQSQPLDSHESLLKKVEELSARYSETSPPPRPKDWSGWRVMPERMEFWQEGKFRLHDRDLYTHTGKDWWVQKLYP